MDTWLNDLPDKTYWSPETTIKYDKLNRRQMWFDYDETYDAFLEHQILIMHIRSQDQQKATTTRKMLAKLSKHMTAVLTIPQVRLLDVANFIISIVMISNARFLHNKVGISTRGGQAIDMATITAWTRNTTGSDLVARFFNGCSRSMKILVLGTV